MGFDEKVRTKVLFKCKRHCCLCGNYVRTHMELHHIRQKADGGDDTEDNCIPLCFNCHAEVKSYNPHHPKGLKYGEKELKLCRNQIYELYKDKVVCNYFKEDVSKAKSLLDEYYQLLEGIINLDPCGQPINILLVGVAEHMLSELKSYKCRFINEDLNREKDNLLESIMQWYNFLCSDSYFHFIDEGLLCFNGNTVNQYRETMKTIRRSVLSSYKIFRIVAEQQAL